MCIRDRLNIGFETAVEDEAEVAALIRTCALRVLESEGVPFCAEIDVTVVNADTVREMNAAYRDKDAVTDVLSFPMYEFYNGGPQEEVEREPDSGCGMLGDMIVCYTRACEQAAEFGHSPARECLSLIHICCVSNAAGARCALQGRGWRLSLIHIYHPHEAEKAAAKEYRTALRLLRARFPLSLIHI